MSSSIQAAGNLPAPFIHFAGKRETGTAARAGQYGFFTHHGFWAPGVRLFRNLGFAAKAGLITLAFLLPLLLLSAAYVRTAQATIDFARQERAGVGILKALEPWLIEVQKQRRLTLTGQAARPDVDAIAQRLAVMRQAFEASGLHLSDELAAVEPLHAAVARIDAATPPAEAARHLQAYVDGALGLRREVLDHSKLILDPDQDTYYLMTLATDVSSDVIESVSRSRAEAGQLRRAGSASPAEVRTLYGIWYLGSKRVEGIASVAGRVAEVNGTIAQRIPSAAASSAATAFFDKASEAWFGNGPHPDPAELDRVGQQAVDQLRNLSAASTAALDELLLARIDRTENARMLMLGVAAASLAAAAYLFYAFYVVMSGGLREVGRHLRAMTVGDLTTSPRPWGRDEAASLMLLMADMQQSLRTMVTQVRTASDGIVQSSSEIADGSSDLSTRTEKTAASLEETASAMEEIGATVRQSTANTQEATQRASGNATIASEGGTVIQQMVQNMQGIQASSKRIEEIIGTIDSIAFQTNILALNAAVEAARAGEQGRGFAVVASEVRALAQRSATAAKEIKTLISDSVTQVEAGTAIVRLAGKSMEEIVDSAGHINTLLVEIATGAHQQSDGLHQVSAAVQELDKATQENAAMVEQTAAAAAALRSQAGDLAAQVARFRLPEPAGRVY